MKKLAIPISLYIHTPWCLHKCPYCDFNSHELRNTLPEEQYIIALINDFRSQLSLLQGRSISSIFIGGGTPSLFSPKAYTTLFNELNKMATIAKDAEITLEANPGTVEQARFTGYRQLGINRLSIGVQSFQDNKLKSLERIHNAADAINAIKTAKVSGFSNINIDLMFGLPQQSIDDGLSDLQTAINCQPTHISWYQLTIEPNTYFHKYPPTLPDDDKLWELQQHGQALLAEHQFNQYEVSAYSQPNKKCQHNLNYWEFGDYLGIGAGAHGKITQEKTFQITRRWNVKNPKAYLTPEKSFLAGEKILAPEEYALEFMMNALRLQKPIPLSLFYERTGLDLESIKKPIEQASQANLLRIDQDHIYLSPNGHRYLNELLAFF